MKAELKEIKDKLLLSTTRNDVLSAINDIDELIKQLNTDKSHLIEESIKNQYGFNFEDLSIKSNADKFSKPRQLAIYLMMKHSKLSQEEVAVLFNRSESSCRWNKRQADHAIDFNSRTRNIIKGIENKINESL
jgi:chromosomal replication initiation ATPase DnaA